MKLLLVINSVAQYFYKILQYFLHTLKGSLRIEAIYRRNYRESYVFSLKILFSYS